MLELEFTTKQRCVEWGLRYLLVLSDKLPDNGLIGDKVSSLPQSLPPPGGQEPTIETPDAMLTDDLAPSIQRPIV